MTHVKMLQLVSLSGWDVRNGLFEQQSVRLAEMHSVAMITGQGAQHLAVLHSS